MLVFGSQAFLLTFSEATQERRYKTIYGVSCFLEDETQINSGAFIEGIINPTVLIPTKSLNADWIIIGTISSIVKLFWYPVDYITSYLKFELDKNYLEGPEMEYQRGAHNNNQKFQW